MNKNRHKIYNALIKKQKTMPEESKIAGTWIKRCIENLKSTLGSARKRISQFFATDQGGSVIFLNDGPLSANDWLYRIVGWRPAGTKCTIEITHTGEECGYIKKWECRVEGKLISRGELMMLGIRSERIFLAYVDDPLDSHE